MQNKKQNQSDEAIRGSIKNYCKTQFGVLDSNFLCQSVSALCPNLPISVQLNATLSEVVHALQKCKIGGVLVVDKSGVLKGIFTERDCVQKIMGKGIALESTPVSEYMTPEPVAQPPDITIAYALNLMSHGGFRHLPIVDQDHMPIGIISIKDVLDHIAGSFLDDLLNFEEATVDGL